MATKYDAEDLLDSVLQIMTDSLNTQIAAVEADKVAKGKGLSPTLAAIASDAFHVQTWTDKVLQKNPAIFYGVEDVEALDGGGVTAKTYKVFVEIVLVDNGQTNDTWRRIQRYARAIEEIFSGAYKPAIEGGKASIEQVRPMAFKLAVDSDDEVKVGGVSIKINLV